MRVQYVPAEHKKPDTIMILVLVVATVALTIFSAYFSQKWGINLAQ